MGELKRAAGLCGPPRLAKVNTSSRVTSADLRAEEVLRIEMSAFAHVIPAIEHPVRRLPGTLRLLFSGRIAQAF